MWTPAVKGWIKYLLKNSAVYTKKLLSDFWYGAVGPCKAVKQTGEEDDGNETTTWKKWCDESNKFAFISDYTSEPNQKPTSTFSFSRERCFIFIWRLLFICLFWDKVWVTFAFGLVNRLKFRILMHWYDEFVFMSSDGWVGKHSMENKFEWIFPPLKRIILLW